MPGKSPRTILFLDHAEALGGAEFSLLTLLSRLNRNQWLPLVACPHGALSEQLETQGITVFPVSMPRLRRSFGQIGSRVIAARDIQKIIHTEKADAVYANTVRSAFYGAVAAIFTGRPLIWHMRDFWTTEAEPAFKAGDRVSKVFLGLLSSRVIANSQAVAGQLPFQNKISVIHNGIEISNFDGFADKGEDGPQVIGMAGRLRPWKGQDRFLRVAAMVHRRLPRTAFVIVGGMPFGKTENALENLHKLASDLGIREAVRLTGHLPDIRPALAGMDIFVHPGEPEPFGRVIIEAMAAAKPVVAFAHGALPEIVVNGETGLLVAPGDENGLADAVCTLIEQPELARQMGFRGRKRVEDHFGAARMTAGIETILHEVLR